MSTQQFDEPNDGKFKLIERICTAFGDRLQRGENVSIADQINQVAANVRLHLFRRLLVIELEARVERGEVPQIGTYEADFPSFKQDIQQAFAKLPTTTPVSRLDEVRAARQPDLASLPTQEKETPGE